ncbi:MAG: N-acetylmuramoyl-L-alanine amidase [Desulfurellaceae bacterium]|nr:N-acetylmuramoyl-L-alanine amidase [Desulfurellaceae bacterium]
MVGGVFRWMLGVVLLASVAPFAFALSPPRPALEEIRHTSVPDYTRVIITLSDRADYRHFRVAADRDHDRPPRIVIDFSSARIDPQLRAPIPVDDGLLKRIRTGQFSPTTARVVLDLEQIESYTAFPLYSPYRLIIDVKGKSEKTPPRQQAKQSRAPPPPQYRIMIDPGHGGRDPGAVGVDGLKEKTVVLAISKRLGKKLESRLPVKVLYTREKDVFVPLPERTAQANATKADLFISIHANASENPRLQGVETYYLNNTNDRATIRLANLENGLASPGSELSFILSDLYHTVNEPESIALAHTLQNSMMTQVSKRHAQARNLGVKKGPFYVLVGAHMPCVLAEVSFLTHRVQGRLLRSSAYREAIAEGLFQGIARFIKEELPRIKKDSV